MLSRKFNFSFLSIVFAIFLFVSCDKDSDLEDPLMDQVLDKEVQVDSTLSTSLFLLTQPELIYPDSDLKKVLEEEINFSKSGKTSKFSDKSDMEVVKKNPKKVYVHYMPWFQSKDYDGYWGQHWTMTNKNPEIKNTQGLPEIASYYNPLIGPYSSLDPALQEYHFLLMKLSGIDGVIFDWYGSRDQYDYGYIKNATEQFINLLENIDLDFSIMYEDRVTAMPNNKLSPKDFAKEDFKYILNTYFNSPNYLKYNESKIVSIFSSDQLTNPKDWEDIFSVFPANQKPALLTLWGSKYKLGKYAAGEFLWVSKNHLDDQDYYYMHYEETNDITIGSVYPGFKSYYSEGGWLKGVNKWSLPLNNGATFNETLHNSQIQNADFIQLITWNDFGEGTMIEPTAEFGFQYLKILQAYTGVSYNEQDLAVATRLYLARKKYEDNPEVMQLLDRSYTYMKKLNIDRVDMIIQAINRFYKVD